MIKEKLYEACLIHYVNSLNEPMLLSLSWQVKMLEALQDIEIASRVVGFDVDSDESLDDKYKKLNCEILPLDHDSSDFKLIEKYLLTTHAPTHKDWTLELEEVFAVERAGEYDSFRPYREKLGNKMLLWHGMDYSKLTTSNQRKCYFDLG